MIDLNELRRLLAAATPGPWEQVVSTWRNRETGYTWSAAGIESRAPELVELCGGTVAYAQREGQIDLNDAAVNVLPALLAVVEAAREHEAAMIASDRAQLATEVNAAYARELAARTNLWAALAALDTAGS